MSKTKRAIFCQRTNDGNATLKLNLADLSVDRQATKTLNKFE
jgi:hypothetical protein